MDINILIGGDIYPANQNQSLFQLGDAVGIFNDLLPEFQNADFSIVNLEGPLIQRPTPIWKFGPVFGADSSCMNGFVKANINAVCLANNHIMDHGQIGLQNTSDVCRKNNILYVGAGKNLDEARKPLIVNIKNRRIAFIAMADYEFSIAGRITWGANPTDVIEFVRIVREYRNDFDILIVLLHEGVQYYPYPSPNLQKLSRFLIEEGANAVVCQHSHCPGAYEFYQDAPIVYGQGDLISPYRLNLGDPRGFLVKLIILSDNKVNMEIIPNMSLPQGGVCRMQGIENEQFISYIEQLCAVVPDTELVENKWQIMCRERADNYYSKILFGYNRVFRRLDSRFHFIKHIMNFRGPRYITVLLNLINCKAHHEIMVTLLEKLHKHKSVGKT